MQDIKVVLNRGGMEEDRAVLLYRAFVQDRAFIQNIGVGQNRGVVHGRAIHYGGTHPKFGNISIQGVPQNSLHFCFSCVLYSAAQFVQIFKLSLLLFLAFVKIEILIKEREVFKLKTNIF